MVAVRCLPCRCVISIGGGLILHLTLIALLSVLAAIGRLYTGPVAGYAVEGLGWVTFSLPGLGLLWRMRAGALVDDAHSPWGIGRRVPRPSVNTGHFRVPSATGCCGVFLAPTVLWRGFATNDATLKSLPRYRWLLAIALLSLARRRQGVLHKILCFLNLSNENKGHTICV